MKILVSQKKDSKFYWSDPSTGKPDEKIAGEDLVAGNTMEKREDGKWYTVED